VEREDERARRADGDLRGAGAVVEDGDVPDGAEAGGGPDEAAVGAAAALERARADAAREEVLRPAPRGVRLDDEGGVAGVDAPALEAVAGAVGREEVVRGLPAAGGHARLAARPVQQRAE